MSEFEVSRRRFIGASAAAGGLATAGGMARTAVAQSGSPPTRTPEMIDVTLEVNGQCHALSVEPRTTLLDAARERANQYEEGLRPGLVQRPHGACRWKTGQCLPDASGALSGQGGHDDPGPGERRRN
jgi:xanthine dehydrogenase YagT iron-sulfur-binding subunit